MQIPECALGAYVRGFIGRVARIDGLRAFEEEEDGSRAWMDRMTMVWNHKQPEGVSHQETEK
jgi:hypothetical protein